MWQVIYLPKCKDFQLFHLLGPLLLLWDHCLSNCLILVPCPAKKANKNTSFPWELNTYSTRVGQDGAAVGQIKPEHCSGPGKQTVCWVFNVLIITLTTEGKMWKVALSGVPKERAITYFHAGCWSADFLWELCIPATFVLTWQSQWSSFSHPHKFWGKAPHKGCRTCCEERGGYWK